MGYNDMSEKEAARPKCSTVGFISTSAYALNFFLMPYIVDISKDARVLLIANTEHGVPEPADNIEFIPFSFRRQPSFFHDLLHLFRLVRLIRQNKMDVI